MMKKALGKAFGFDVASRTAREVGSQIGGAGSRTYGLMKWFRKAVFGSRDDGFRPSSTDAHKRFLEAMQHYGADPAFVAKRIERTHRAFLAHAIIAIAAIVFAIVSPPLTSIGSAFLAAIFAVQAFQSAVENHVLRHRAAPGLRAVLFSGDLLPKGN